MFVEWGKTGTALPQKRPNEYNVADGLLGRETASGKQLHSKSNKGPTIAGA